MPKDPSRPKPLPRRWANLDEAADYTGLSALTMRRRVADGTIRGYRLGSRTLRVDLNEIDEAMRPIPAASGH